MLKSKRADITRSVSRFLWRKSLGKLSGHSCHWRIGYMLYSFSLEDQTSGSLKLMIRTLGPDSCTMV